MTTSNTIRGEYFFAGACNYKCFFCISDEIGVKRTTGHNARLQGWIDLLKSKHVEMVTLSSFNSEPTIQKDFVMVAETLLDNGFKLELRTNGTFKQTPEMYALLNRFDNIWFSIQSLNSDHLHQIASVRKVPDFKTIWTKLPNVDCRISFLVNQFNKSEINDLLELANTAKVNVMQIRKFYIEDNNDRVDVNTEAFEDARNIVNQLEVVKDSKFNEYLYKTVKVSLWDDVLENETGIKYFPYTELITDIGRIVPTLQSINA